MNLPNALLGWIAGSVHDPLAVAGRGRIFGVRSIVGYLSWAAPIGVGDPDLGGTAAVRTPDDLLAIRHERGVPIHGRIVCDPAHDSVFRRDFPEILIAAPGRAE